MDFKKIFLTVAISFSIALSLFGIIYITQPTNAAISPTLLPIFKPTNHPTIQPSNHLTGKPANRSEAEIPTPFSSLCRVRQTGKPHPPEDNEQIDLFDLYLFKEYFAQEKVDFRLPISESFALVTNFPSPKKQEKGNNSSTPINDGRDLPSVLHEGRGSLSLVNFDQNALVGLRYTHQGTIWDTKVKVVTGLVGHDGGYRFILSLTKNF